MRRFISYALALALVLCLVRVARAIPVDVKVVGPDGASVPGAWVVVNDRSEVLIADKDGKITVEAEPASQTLQGFGYVYAYAPGFVVTGQQVRPTGTTVGLVPAVPIAGVVRDGAGQPVAGLPVRLVYYGESGVTVTVTPWRPGGVSVPRILREKLAARTKADGSWVLSVVPAGVSGTLEIDEPGFVYASAFFKPDRLVPPLVAYRAAAIHGRLLYEDGQPASGVKISATRSEPVHVSQSATAGPDGTYRMTRLPPGRFFMDFESLAEEWITPYTEHFILPEGGSVAVPDLVLRKGGFIEGVVTDAGTGKPLEGVSVQVQNLSRPASRSALGAETRNDGKYRRLVPPGNYRVFVYRAPEAYPVDTDYDARSVKVTVDVSQTVSVPLQLRQGLRLTGVAFDENGNPAAGARLYLGGSGVRKDTVTDAAGN